MSRITIDFTTEEHNKLKALAALEGKSISEYVHERALQADDEKVREDALVELESFLDKRIREAETLGVSKRTVGEIFKQAYDEAGKSVDA